MRHVSRFPQPVAEPLEHRAPAAAMGWDRRLWELLMDQMQSGRARAVGLELEGDEAGLRTGVLRLPGKHQAARWLDLEIRPEVLDFHTVAPHHDPDRAADAKVDLGLHRADRRHPFLKPLRVGPPLKDLVDRGWQSPVDLDRVRADHFGFRA